jgi:hypothetical protein
MVIVQHLVRILPQRYVAEPRVHLGSQVEIDVSAYDRESGERESGAMRAGPSALWAPALPTLTVETELADSDEYEVRVYDTVRNRRLVAAVELISPSNKDRPEARAQFVSKCAAMLRQSVAVVLVDVITVKAFNLYAELLEWLAARDGSLGQDAPATYAAACRWRPREGRRLLEAWSRPLVVGQPLPVLPLWLSDELAVPLDLEATYQQTCADLRIA